MAFKDKLRRTGSLFGASAFAFALVATAVPQQASAYALLSDRSIQLSSSASGATADYLVNFTTSGADAVIGSVVVQFCSNSPILGDTCNNVTGLNATVATISGQSGTINGLTKHGNSNANNVILTRTANSVASGAQEFTLQSITNPTNSNVTFYARIMTFASTDGSGDQVTGSVHAGGIALSTANLLQVTAKVQETLIFCVYTGANCGAGGTGVILGDGNGVLALTTTEYLDTAGFDVASNAVSGVTVRLKGGLPTSGSGQTLPSIGATCTLRLLTTGSSYFGFRVSTAGASQTAAVPYNCAADNYSFDLAQTNTTYGQTVATTSGANDVSSSELTFAAKASSTTQAGIYNTNLTMVATARY